MKDYLIKLNDWVLVYAIAFLLLTTIAPISALAESNLIANFSMETASVDGLSPEFWTYSSYGVTATGTYPVLGKDGGIAVRAEVSETSGGDAKWYFEPVNINQDSRYAYVEYYRSDVTTRIVVAEFFPGDVVQYREVISFVPPSAEDWSRIAFEFQPSPSAEKVSVYHVLHSQGWLEVDETQLFANLPPQIVDMVPNNSVEQTSWIDPSYPLGWLHQTHGQSTVTFSYVDGDGYNGNRSVRVDMTDYVSGDAKWYFEQQPLTPGQDYRFTGWYKTNTIPKVVAWFTLDTGEHVYYGMPNPQPDSESETSWQKYSGEFSVPNNAVGTSVFFFIDRNGWVQTDNFSIEPYQFQGFERPIITITFDDGAKINSTTMLPVLKEYGFKTTQCYMTEILANEEEQLSVLEFYEDGHEICSHTTTHPFLTRISDEQVVQELSVSKSILEGLIGKNIVSFASPFGDYNAAVNARIAEYYSYHRTVDEGYNDSENLNLLRLRAQNMKPDTKIEEFEAWINKAIQDKTWLIIVYHQVLPDDTDPQYVESYDTLKSDFDAQMSLLNSKVVSGQIDVMRLDEAISMLTGEDVQDVCPNMEGVQENIEECEEPVDACPEVDGIQENTEDCEEPTDTEEPVDVCPEIDGVQENVEQCEESTEEPESPVTPSNPPTPSSRGGGRGGGGQVLGVSTTGSKEEQIKALQDHLAILLKKLIVLLQEELAKKLAAQN